jgi:hypothetical protein
MKNILLLIGFVCFQSIYAQNIMDLSLKNVQLQGMEPAKVNQEMKDIGIKEMPFVTENPEVISKIVNVGTAPKIKKLYGFTYINPKDDLNDGGVFVYQFSNKKDLDSYIAENFEQPNSRALVKDLFYIEIWSDYSYQVKGKETSEDHLNKMEKYYLKLGAKRIKLKADDTITDTAASATQ